MQEASGTDSTHPTGLAQLSSFFDPLADQLPNSHCRLHSRFRLQAACVTRARRRDGGAPARRVPVRATALAEL